MLPACKVWPPDGHDMPSLLFVHVSAFLWKACCAQDFGASGLLQPAAAPHVKMNLHILCAVLATSCKVVEAP